jgi:hypothetical protein
MTTHDYELGYKQKLAKSKEMKPLKSKIKVDAAILLDASIETIFNTLHKKYKTSSGDISPYHLYLLDDIKTQLVDMFSTQVFQNIQFDKTNLKSLNRDELMELAYSLDWNGSWDCDEEGQKPITRNELIQSITDLISHNQ